jgi:hypothetical protein
MDYIEELEEAYEKDKPKLKGLVKSHSIPVTSRSAFEEFKAALSPFILNSQISTQHTRLYFEDLKEKAIQEEQIDEKRKKRLLDQFVTLLKRNRNLTFNSKWEEVKESLLPQITLASSFGGIESILSEQERIQAFQDHVATLLPPPPPPSSSSTSPAPTSTTSTSVLSTTVPVSSEAPSGEVKEKEEIGGEESKGEEVEQPPIAGEENSTKKQDEEEEEGALSDSPNSTKKRTREKVCISSLLCFPSFLLTLLFFCTCSCFF